MAINQIGWANKQESQAYAQNLIADVKNGNQDAIDSICSGIFDSTAGRLGTNEAFVEEVINNADAETLALIMDRYSEVTGSEIYKDIENDYSGKSERELIEKLENAYTSTKDEEYTGWDDGKLNNKQIATSVGKGILDKLPSIGLIAAGTVAAPAIASATGAILTGVLGAATAATVATIAAPVLAVAGIAAAGYMIYKGVTETKEAIDKGKNSQDDNTTMDAVRQGTNGVIETAEGVYIGAQSVKGLVESTKNIKTQIGKNNATEAPVEPKPSGETVENSDLNKTTNTELASSMSKAETNKPIQFSDEEIATIKQNREMRQLYKAYTDKYDSIPIESRTQIEEVLRSEISAKNSALNNQVVELADSLDNVEQYTVRVTSTSSPGNTHSEKIEIVDCNDELIGSTHYEYTSNDLHISLMENYSEGSIKGVGTELHKLIAQRSMEVGYQGNVTLDSVADAVGFHYKTGFRSHDASINALIEQAIQKYTGTRFKFTRGVNMYLPKEAIAKLIN